MVTNKAVGTMSVDGWVMGVKPRIVRLFAYWLANYKEQSYVASTNIASFQELIQRHGRTPEDLCSSVGSNLGNFLSAHFDQVDVVCTPSYARSEREDKFYTLVIDVTLKQDGIGYDVGKALVEVTDGAFYKVIEGL